MTEEQQTPEPDQGQTPSAAANADAGGDAGARLVMQYSDVLSEFLRAQSEKALYDASQLSKVFIERGIGPEEIVAVHTEIIDSVTHGLPILERGRAISLSLQFLLEVMIAYGISYKEYLDYKLTEATRAIERQLEMDRIKAQEEVRVQREVLRAKEEFLEFVTHELRNPLATLMGSIEYMISGLGREEPERRERLLVRMKESANQLTRMVNDLLTVSRAEAIENPLRMEPVDLDALAHSVVTSLASDAAAQGVELTAHLAGGSARILGDREWLAQGVANVVADSLKFTGAGGKVWVNTRGGRSTATIEVGDNGPGISPEDLLRVFDKYYQVRRGSEGVGLGLHLTRRIVERHGGEITVESELGQGTIFRISLPTA